MLRLERNLSIRALAERSGLNVNTFSLIEHNRISTSVSTLQQIAQARQVPIGAFFEMKRGHKKVVYQKAGQRTQPLSRTARCGTWEPACRVPRW